LVNIFIHAANGWLLFAVLRMLLLRSKKLLTLPKSSAAFIPLTASALFIAHPLQIESVTYIIQRFTLMAALFSLLTYWLHLLANEASSRSRRLVLRVGSVLAVVLGMLSKESVFVAPGMILLLDWVVMGTGFKAAFRRALPLLACMAIVPAMVLFTTWAADDGKLTLDSAINVASRDVAHSHYEYVLTSLRVVLTYARLIVFPTDLNVDPDIDWSRTMADWRVLLSASTIVAIVGGTWMIFLRRAGDLRTSMLFASVVSYFASLVTSSGLVPLPDAMAEHRAYEASIGILVALVCLFDFARTRTRWGRLAEFAFPAAVAVWVIALSWATLLRNEVWRSPVALWGDTVAKSPGKWRPRFNLGCAYVDMNQLEGAVSCFREVIRLEPKAVMAYTSLAGALNQLHRSSEAMDVCREAMARGLDTPELGHVTGVTQCHLGRIDAGIQTFLAVLQKSPAYQATHVMLGVAYTQINREDLALKHFRQAAACGPEDPFITDTIRQLETLPSQHQISGSLE
jgi:tetratricopeptide (TPR) repeat protein